MTLLSSCQSLLTDFCCVNNVCIDSVNKVSPLIQYTIGRFGDVLSGNLLHWY